MSRIRATLWDLGGVLYESPFEAFARYERERGLPGGFIRRLNATNPDANAWARLERGEIDPATFVELFEAEARAAGGALDGWEVLGLLRGELRAEMVAAVRRCRAAGLRTGALTNTIALPAGGAAPGGGDGPAGGPRSLALDASAGPRAELDGLFDVVVESSRVGLRKPDPRIYELACELLGVAPAEVVFLDDLGVNLKPARALGMRTIKVTDPTTALTELESILGIPLR